MHHNSQPAFSNFYTRTPIFAIVALYKIVLWSHSSGQRPLIFLESYSVLCHYLRVKTVSYCITYGVLLCQPWIFPIVPTPSRGDHVDPGKCTPAQILIDLLDTLAESFNQISDFTRWCRHLMFRLASSRLFKGIHAMSKVHARILSAMNVWISWYYIILKSILFWLKYCKS